MEIRDNCFGAVRVFKIDGLSELKSLKIGNYSFTESILSFDCNVVKSFQILNCEKLKSIKIGRYSFCDFGGEFELRNLPSLRFLKIGKKNKESCNFYQSSFILRSNRVVEVLPNRSALHKIGITRHDEFLLFTDYDHGKWNHRTGIIPRLTFAAVYKSQYQSTSG